ncbi:uncharacterized protein LOC144879110 [Branchiostoma floridae x Branchiostoma japonicum]
MPRRDEMMPSAWRNVLVFYVVFCGLTVSALHKEFSETFVEEDRSGVHGPPVVRPVPTESKPGPPHSTQPQDSSSKPTRTHSQQADRKLEVKSKKDAEILERSTQNVQSGVQKPIPPHKAAKQEEKVASKEAKIEFKEDEEVLDHWQDFPEQPLQLVMPDVTHKKLVLVQQNVKLLHRISGAVATIAVVGKFHSGKSFLMNQLMGKSTGFGVGPYVRPHTMGIWMWGKPMEMTLPSGDKLSVIFLDTEGFAANNISENYDAKIFAVSTLLSSYLIYNSVKIIDQADIDYLEVLARRTQLFALRSQMSRSKWADDFNHDLLSFPPLLWVVQDFAQLLGDNDSPQEWLRKLMDTSAWDNEDYEISLLGVFNSVDCHTLFLPATRRELLQDLSQAREEDLTDEYREERDSLISKLRKGLVPKEKNDQPITGAELASLLDILVNAANEGSLAQIPSRWNVFIDKLERTAKEDCLLFYEGEMAVLYKGRDNGPIIPQELEDWHNQMYNKSLDLLQHLLFGLGDSVEVTSLDLGREIRSKFDKTLEINDKKIKLRCTEWQRRLELEAEERLENVQLPTRSSLLEEEFVAVETSCISSFQQEVGKLLGKKAYRKYMEQLKSSLQNVHDKFALRNTRMLEDLLDQAVQNAIDGFREKAVIPDKSPLSPGAVVRQVAEATLTATKIFSAEAKAAEGEKMYEPYQAVLQTRMSEEQERFEEANSELVRLFCLSKVRELVDEFRSSTGSTEIILPINSTELEMRLKQSWLRVEAQYRDAEDDYSLFTAYEDGMKTLQERVEEVYKQRRQENVEAFAREVDAPLKTARDIIKLSADKYDTVFSVTQYIRQVCLLQLNQGQPKYWHQELKASIIDHFIQSEKDIQRIIQSRQGWWSAVVGFFQWLLWIFRIDVL